MNDRIKKAEDALDAVHDWQADEGITEETMITVALEAQTQATLALAEQQRIANLLQYAWTWPMARPELRDQIEKELGL